MIPWILSNREVKMMIGMIDCMIIWQKLTKMYRHSKKCLHRFTVAFQYLNNSEAITNLKVRLEAKAEDLFHRRSSSHQENKFLNNKSNPSIKFAMINLVSKKRSLRKIKSHLLQKWLMRTRSILRSLPIKKHLSKTLYERSIYLFINCIYYFM